MTRATGAIRTALGQLSEWPQPAVTVARPALATVTRLGWGVIALGLAAWIAGARLGWAELEWLAAACLVTMVMSVGFLVGRALLSIEVELEPQRVVVGNPAAGRIVVTNVSKRRLMPLAVELPVGAGAARFDVPSLASGGAHEELIIVPTHRRAVIAVGPASSVRGDPLGMLRREVPWSRVIELFVHPRTVGLNALSSGFLRDLEGQATNNTSVSDLAFHALREYEPGDDRRHIHWRTTARTGRIMVRQFVDTRRSHLAVVVDADPAHYADAEDFELAVSAAGSLALRAMRDEQTVSVVAAGHAVARGDGRRILDTLSRAELGTGHGGLVKLCSQAARLASDASIAFLVTGSSANPHTLREAGSRFPIDTRVLVLRVEQGHAASRQALGNLTVLGIGHLDQLGPVVRAVGGA